MTLLWTMLGAAVLAGLCVALAHLMAKLFPDVK